MFIFIISLIVAWITVADIIVLRFCWLVYNGEKPLYKFLEELTQNFNVPVKHKSISIFYVSLLWPKYLYEYIKRNEPVV